MGRESWFIKAKRVLEYHDAMLQDKPEWRLEDTARDLNLSTSGVGLQVRCARAAIDDPVLQSLTIAEVRRKLENVEFHCEICGLPNLHHSFEAECIDALKTELQRFRKVFGRVRLRCKELISEIEDC